ncbi:MAG TPA: hypothetical protein VGR87_03005 [Candidatus Limnocylindria bacterium]|jgi:hypothetical protein|nr:hypothetical protein [Candidatus Limnocylindria bacterium]
MPSEGRESRKLVLVVEDDRVVGELIAGAISDEPGYTAVHVLEPPQRSRRRRM